MTPHQVTASDVDAAKHLVTSRRAQLRLERAKAFLLSLPGTKPALVLGPSFETAAELTRGLGKPVFGWLRSTLFRFAADVASAQLLERGLTLASGLTLHAVWERVAQQLARDGQLGRLSPLAGKPGLARALAQTVGELRAFEHLERPESGRPESNRQDGLEVAASLFARSLEDNQLIDRCGVYRLALEVLPSTELMPTLLLDLDLAPGVELEFAQALVGRAPSALVTALTNDGSWPGLQHHPLSNESLRGVRSPSRPQSVLEALQENLFAPETSVGVEGELMLFSAPGEARECVEIARHALRLAEVDRVPFERMAVFLRSPGTYRAPLEEAFRRAKLPGWFSSGISRPDAAGRAMLALLACADERLSARRFSEYLSLAQVPRLREGAPPPADPGRFVHPRTEALPPSREPADELEPPPLESLVDDVEAPSVLGQLRAPRRWEKLIVEASVIGGADRWRRRLKGLEDQKRKATLSPTATEGQLARLERDLRDLEALSQFALPLIETLEAFPSTARWEQWLGVLRGLATRALRFPTRVLAVLNELAPLGPVGPVSLAEVRGVLTPRLSEVTDAPLTRRHGAIFVGTPEEARGLSFEVVFVPGLAERVFPQKIREDPLLSDDERRALDPRLTTNERRVALERQALQWAVGAATRQVLLSYPRVDPENGRPRVPSFYALEAARAVDGTVWSFEKLQSRAEGAVHTTLAWPAPRDAHTAIDETEFDLAVLDDILRHSGPVTGRGRYLMTTNAHLARALRARYSRWQLSSLTPWDGLVRPSGLGRQALSAHQFNARPFSPTSLEHYAACPYRFFLSTVIRLEPLRIPEELEELGPLEKGSMAHQIQFELLSSLARDGVALEPTTLELVLARLHETLRRVTSGVFDRFKPAIERVWEDGVDTLEADLREWIRRAVAEPTWKPAHFELSFGLAGRDPSEQDPRSVPTPVTLVEGLQVRGSIDLVERASDGRLRATDYKTGRPKAEDGNIIGGGRHLQPVLYALVLERLFEGAKVEGGRLYYMTQAGGFTSIATQLDAQSREAFGALARTLRESLETGFFPAAPEEESDCTYCNFRSVCGPDEARRLRRTRKGVRKELAPLRELRGRR